MRAYQSLEFLLVLVELPELLNKLCLLVGTHLVLLQLLLLRVKADLLELGDLDLHLVELPTQVLLKLHDLVLSLEVLAVYLLEELAASLFDVVIVVFVIGSGVERGLILLRVGMFEPGVELLELAVKLNVRIVEHLQVLSDDLIEVLPRRHVHR